MVTLRSVPAELRQRASRLWHCVRRADRLGTRHLSTEAAACDTGKEAAAEALPSNVEVAVIGGGAVGTSLAYHLARMGNPNVVLLEKSELTAGSTWHAAGLAALYNPGINMKRIHYDSINLFAALQLDTGRDLGFHRPGSIRLASDPTRVDEFRYQMQRQGWNKAPQKLITVDEIREHVPFINLDKVLGGLYNPADGHIDPYSLTMAMASEAKRYGARIFQGTAVLGLRKDHKDDRWCVETSRGPVRAKHVVNCAGFWAHEVNALAGVDLPLVPIHHQYFITSSIPEVKNLKKEIPVLRHLEGGFYMRQERDGLLIGPYEHQDKMKICDDWVTNRVPPGFGKELFNPDLDRLTDHIESAMELVPALRTAEIRTTVSGPITYTADSLPCIGPMPRFPNYWVAVGFAYGIIHSGGAGRYLAEWMTKGEPPYDLVETDPGRFGKWATRSYLFSKSKETYGMNNSFTFPKEERWAGRPTERVSGIHDQLVERGAEMGFHAGWEQPAWFSQPGDVSGYQPSFRRSNWFEPMKRECRSVLDSVGVIDLTPFAKFQVTGKGASRFLDKLLANKLPAVNSINISHMLTPRGRVYAEVTVTRLEENRYLIITGSGSELHDFRWMDDHLRLWKMDDVKIDNVTDSVAALGIAGPHSANVLASLTDVPLSDDKFPFLHAREISVCGIPVTAMRVSYTGELGWELYHDRKNAAALYNQLLRFGEPYDIKDFGTYALNSLRIEKGFRLWGADMTVDTNSFEAGLGPFVKMKKAADFIGKAALRQILSEGLSRKLVHLAVYAPEVDPEGNESVWCSDKVVGYTTSGSYGVQSQQSLAMAYLPMYLTIPGSEVQVELLGKLCSATVLPSAPVAVQVKRRKPPRTSS
ncbi:dimethylglycine dehydrogenase, mitochondrial-like isoform X1 [Dermacentor albipictus]|uniref:dimethylglycine dehydrogenase, mitochondrial-like isoform X1 n=2 Tax=Dermacentor albipictus TaxID=60249 RepID=UPI0031FE0763